MIYTVTGRIEKAQMGAALSHEHIKWEFDDFCAAQMYFDKKYDDEATRAAYDVLLPVFKALCAASCKTVVDASPPVGGTNIKLYRKLSAVTGINIIACTGMNMFKQIYQVLKEKFAEQMAARWVSDFENGFDTLDGTVVRPGYIKLLLDKGSLSDVDREMLKAAVIASKQTGMPIHCHIMEAQMALDVFALLKNEGADFSKFLWAHADNEGNLDVINRAIDLGMWVGFDLIKRGTHEEKCSLVRKMIGLGRQGRVLLSQDVDFYEEAKNGREDHCASLFTDFVPYCGENGIERDTLLAMLTDNPAGFYDIP